MGEGNLATLYSRFHSRTARLVECFKSSAPSTPAHGEACRALETEGREREIIKLQMYWGEFCRELVLRSAMGGWRTLAGNTLGPASVMRRHDVIRTARRMSNGAHPPWHVPSFCGNVVSQIGTQNQGQIQMGLGIVAPVQDLLDVRNYVVHPSQVTETAFRRVGMSYGQPRATPSALLSSEGPGGGTLFETWVENLRDAARAAIR